MAKEAGVSVTTVSRFLNNHPYITDSKKQAIEIAMEKLNYVQNSAATQLRSKKSNFIGVLVSRLSNPFFTSLVDKIEAEAKISGFQIIVLQSYDDKNAESRILKLLQQGVLAGIIMCSIESGPNDIEQYTEYGPIILCNIANSESKLPQVYSNQEQGTYDALTYLFNQGYRKFAYCTGGSLSRHSHGGARTRAFEKAINDYNLKINKNWIFYQSHTIEDGKYIGEKILKLNIKEWPDVIFSNSDEIAAGLLKTFSIHNIKVPEDIAIIGFDDQKYSELLSTPLTTIRQPIDALAMHSVNYLISLLKNEEYEFSAEDLQLELVIREST
ncbi:LacI family DNA-binding transcriptional regulator [Aerococcus kribbianus]|uniref:LacI family DNA-binding transcriptional regulator n=1 Tax=Aerococcus kribbianus TaxID=2999064 RepID=A0A9X3FLS3_9LACT|nr:MULTISPECIES: LacI family DNA-binding transcriptional regulator [unclassified Aerococcus]MCZ0716835.1 LacI family DNA-binding transcriptional regulator [Aerococcus sp. YH-aer221]MCZ0725123.1 LacI family DNA-binding transcriptional regulator [Aerococcus sp. YH-aer222]